jgi:hypothetical protein
MKRLGRLAGAPHMKHIKLELTLEELTLLASLASDQLFRREFIDPKMPGYKAKPAEVHLGKALVGRLRLVIVQASRESGSSSATETERVSTSGPKRSIDITNAL